MARFSLASILPEVRGTVPIFARAGEAAVMGYGAGMIEDTMGSNDSRKSALCPVRDGPTLRAV